MSKYGSPLRYPGGKGTCLDFFGAILDHNGLAGGLYAEPFAGGAGAAVGLLLHGWVDRIAINDADPRVYAFWKSALKNTTKFVNRIEAIDITLEEWHRQRDTYLNPKGRSALAVGFAAFFLNRCNRSGIMVNGGPIGGQHQSGELKITARFNKEALIGRIRRLSEFGDRIEVFGEDGIEFMNRFPQRAGKGPAIVYLDPPYFAKGSRLYMNHFSASDHARFGEFMRTQKGIDWFMTYDDVPEIRDIYGWANCRSFGLMYSAYEKRKGNEVLIWPDGMIMPQVTGSLRLSRND